MSKYSVDYKTVERENFTIVTKQAKQVFSELTDDLLIQLNDILRSPGLQYFTIRKVNEKVPREPKAGDKVVFKDGKAVKA